MVVFGLVEDNSEDIDVKVGKLFKEIVEKLNIYVSGFFEIHKFCTFLHRSKFKNSAECCQIVWQFSF